LVRVGLGERRGELMPVGVRVEGAKALSRALRKAGISIQDLKDANERVADVVAREADPLTPRRSGRLVGSIRSARMQSGAVVRAGGGAVRYAKFVEYGTHRMAAQPFLTTGMTRSQPRWMDVYFAEIQLLMDRVAASADGTD
jgi:HK97 gp10 family phage protein